MFDKHEGENLAIYCLFFLISVSGVSPSNSRFYAKISQRTEHWNIHRSCFGNLLWLSLLL